MAAGLGTRMKSKRAKVLHELGGAPLIAHVVRAAQELDPKAILVVVGHQAEEVEQAALAAVGELEFHGVISLAWTAGFRERPPTIGSGSWPANRAIRCRIPGRI